MEFQQNTLANDISNLVNLSDDEFDEWIIQHQMNILSIVEEWITLFEERL